jgi:excinuclease ABC subunit C
MMDAKGNVIYVGKAKNLKKRVSSYFHRQLDTKTLQLVKQIQSIQVTITRNEREAYLLENNLIKELQPRYNIIFKDDKSYPYLYLSTHEPFPRLSFHRGKKTGKGKYFGPYPSARLAREALYFLQRIFKLRQCDNTFFMNRTRPCLQYQIKRCTAPCVGFISEIDYRKEVENALLFLEGKSQKVISELAQRMEVKSTELEYEEAAKLRDQIALLKSVQEQQIIVGKDQNIDVLGVAIQGYSACVHVLMIREGKMLGTRHYFPKPNAILAGDTSPEQELLEDFIMQHYCQHDDPSELPKEILIERPLEKQTLLEELLQTTTNRAITLNVAKRGIRTQWMDMAKLSASAALKGQLQNKTDLTPRFEALQEALQLDSIPQRLECFDVSHTQGEATVASCVVFDQSGPLKSAYRRFNIKGVTKGDDYGALKIALTRHYTRLKSEGGILPDILFIDGGKGQLGIAVQVLTELQVSAISLIGIAKGPSRKPGLETLYLGFLPNGNGHGNGHTGEANTLTPTSLSPDSPALHLIQQIRDEAHRFAITAHRKQRSKRGLKSKLEDIPGIGRQRRITLLKQFGGLQEVLQASAEELAKVPGINKALAERIYSALHGE